MQVPILMAVMSTTNRYELLPQIGQVRSSEHHGSFAHTPLHALCCMMRQWVEAQGCHVHAWVHGILCSQFCAPCSLPPPLSLTVTHYHTLQIRVAQLALALPGVFKSDMEGLVHYLEPKYPRTWWVAACTAQHGMTRHGRHDTARQDTTRFDTTRLGKAQHDARRRNTSQEQTALLS